MKLVRCRLHYKVEHDCIVLVTATASDWYQRDQSKVPEWSKLRAAQLAFRLQDFMDDVALDLSLTTLAKLICCPLHFEHDRTTKYVVAKSDH
jgi:hypothetical protein